MTPTPRPACDACGTPWVADASRWVADCDCAGPDERPTIERHQPTEKRQMADQKTAEELLDATQGYFIYDSRAKQWLQEDERSWDEDTSDAAQFSEWGLAMAIAKRERPDMNGILVLAWIDPDATLK